jgi:hypothetical protein
MKDFTRRRGGEFDLLCETSVHRSFASFIVVEQDDSLSVSSFFFLSGETMWTWSSPNSIPCMLHLLTFFSLEDTHFREKKAIFGGGGSFASPFR